MPAVKAALLRDIAFSYWQDACDYRDLFELQWNNHEEFGKTARIKILLNLVMACECALKTHVVLGSSSKTPKEVLQIIRKSGHDIPDLASKSFFVKDRVIYDVASELLKVVSVHVRYTLDASFTYFRNDEAFEIYDLTIANPAWRKAVKVVLCDLIDTARETVLKSYDFDMDINFQVESELKNLLIRKK